MGFKKVMTEVGKRIIKIAGRELPVGELFLKFTDVDEVAVKQVVNVTDVAMAAVLENLQDLRGREIKLSITIRVDEILGEENATKTVL